MAGDSPADHCGGKGKVLDTAVDGQLGRTGDSSCPTCGVWTTLGDVPKVCSYHSGKARMSQLGTQVLHRF